MRKINTLFTANSQLEVLTKNVQAHQRLQQFWQAASPKLLAQASYASKLDNSILTVYADSAIVANKIKLTQASLLTQLGNLQKNNPIFRECKVTAIVVKVQVKSQPPVPAKPLRKPSEHGANSLKKLALDLGESALAAKLNSIAEKISRR